MYNVYYIITIIIIYILYIYIPNLIPENGFSSKLPAGGWNFLASYDFRNHSELTTGIFNYFAFLKTIIKIFLTKYFMDKAFSAKTIVWVIFRIFSTSPSSSVIFCYKKSKIN